MFEWLFKKKITTIEQEEQIEKEVIEYNTNTIKNIYGVVIKYDPIPDSDVPVITKICDFHCEILPMVDSIIWAPNKDKNRLVPYKVVRYDYFEDGDNSQIAHIVVIDATFHDIVSNDSYDLYG